MSVTRVDRDTESMTLTLIADFEGVPVEQVWELWADPRRLERWWGPPSHPATMQEHDLTPGGTVTYYMTSPEGERHHGWWRITAADPPRALEFEDGFADADGNPSDAMPTTTISVTLHEREGGTRMQLSSRFASREGMEQMLAMGMDEGLQQAVGQMDGLLAAV